MNELLTWSAAVLAERLAARDVSSVEVTSAHVDRIAEVEPDLHAFLHVAGDAALARAEEIDRLRAAGRAPSPLAGVPIAIKDVLCTNDMPSTAASRILEGWIPPYDATIGGPAARRRPGADPGQDQHGRVRDGQSSTEHSAYGAHAQPVGSGAASPVVRVADPRQQLRRSRRRSRSAPTPAGPSVSPRPSPARSVRSRRTAVSRATALIALASSAWTRSGPVAHAPCWTPALLHDDHRRPRPERCDSSLHRRLAVDARRRW